MRSRAEIWSQVLRGCTTLERSGCALAWCLAREHLFSPLHEGSNNGLGIFNSDMKRGTGRKGSVFPLSEGDFNEALRFLRSVALEETFSEAFVALWSHTAWKMLACYACQTLDTGHVPFGRGSWNKAQKRMVSAVDQSVCRLESLGHAEVSDVSAVEKELKSKRVSYEGEELGVCHKLSFNQVLPALPPKEHGGSIDVLEFVSETTKEMLLNPEKLVVLDVGQELPKLQGRVHVESGEMDKIAAELVMRGVCHWIPYSSVFEFRGQKILNGLFGVEKSGRVEGNKPILRLIMNLIPSNSVLKQFTGSTKGLPHITAWLSTFIEEGQELRLWQSDMANAFYLFYLPKVWHRFLAFNVVRRKSDVMGGADDSLVCLSCGVLPMGWGSSVSVMQEVSERLLVGSKLLEDRQVMRGRGLPLWMVGLLEESHQSGKAWWHIYLDNFAACQVGDPAEGFEHGEAIHQEAEALWKRAGVVSAEKKRKRCEVSGQELGAFVHGEARVMGPSPERLVKLIQATLVVLQRKSLSRKLVQVICGRWIHVFQFRRPAMSLLEACWEYISAWGTRYDLQVKVRRELFACLSAVPLLHTFLGGKIGNVTTASDASHKGGAVGIAKQLSPAGEDFVRSSLIEGQPRKSGIMVLSLFHGIGGSFRAYDILGIRPDALVAFDIHKPAMRVTSRRWPQTEMFGDVKDLNEALLEKLLMKYPEITEIHLWGGFPCIDLSSVNVLGRGLAGPQSSLFFEFVRVLRLLKKKSPRHVKIKYVAENVASMPKSECTKISDELRTRPYHLNCADAVPMQRPRLCWTSEELDGCLQGLEFTEREYWTEIKAEAAYPSQEQWITPGTWWPGEFEGHTLPTALKSIARKKPPPSPAGYHRCDEETLARWTGDSFRFPPYHYMPRFLFWTEDKWRLANSSEKEILLGYGAGHTCLCFSASLIKQSQIKYEDERLSLLGDSFSVLSFVIPAAGLCPNTGVISLKETKTGLRNAAHETVSRTNILALEVLRAAIEEHTESGMSKLPLWLRWSKHTAGSMQVAPSGSLR
eukprot:s832_g17.t1